MKMHLLALTDLRCEHQHNPLGLDTPRPRFSWKLVSNRQGVRQMSYRLVVRQGEATVWDSGTVTSSASVLADYRGSGLAARSRFDWQVTVSDEMGNLAVAEAWFETGLLGPEDRWGAWVEPAQEPATREPKLPFFETIKPVAPDFVRAADVLKPCPLLRREFAVKGPLRRARLWATAHGVYSIELNGRRVSDIELAPEATAYQDYLQYQTYDLEPYLTLGSNALGAVLADGWWAGRVGLPGESCHYGDRLALWLQVELEYADGCVERWGSDESWRSSVGGWQWSDLAIGEAFDARRQPTGWTNPGFDDKAWTPVEVVDYSTANLRAQYGEPVRAVKELSAVALLTTPRGETVVDFGQVLAGRVRLTVRGPAGAEVKLEHTEVLDADGNYLYTIMGRNKDQVDLYTLCGDGIETFEPRFTYHGFRYVRITGFPGTPQAENFTAVVIASDLESTGEFSCSDPRLNQLQSNIVWSQRGNMVSIPTDCPQREKGGFTGDAQVYAPTACFNTGMAAFLTRWLRNLALEQRPDGQVPVIVPYWSSYHGSAGNSDSSAGWGEACIIVPWVLYDRYRDLGVLEEAWPTMVRWVDYCQRSASEGKAGHQKYLWNTGFHFGDWMIPSVLEASGGNPMPTAFATKELVATCFYAWSCELMGEIAMHLGKNAEADRYRELNRKIREAFAQEYLGTDGSLAAEFQGIYVLALKMQMVPETARSSVLAHLVRLIEANGTRLDTGFVSVPFLLDVLCDGGRNDLAYRLLLQTACPSWLYEVEHGATTIWESWSAISPSGKPGSFSFNHYAFGCVGDWMYRYLGGLRPGKPGYKHSLISPAFDAPLQSAQASLETPYGRLSSHWWRDSSSVRLEVTIPANTTATVKLPDGRSVELGSGSYLF